MPGSVSQEILRRPVECWSRYGKAGFGEIPDRTSGQFFCAGVAWNVVEGRPSREEAGMNTPYGLEIVESCQNCRLKREECFCNLSAPALKRFSAISHRPRTPQKPHCSWRARPRAGFSCCVPAK